VWHVGHDADASILFPDIYNGSAVDDALMSRFLKLLRIEFKDPGVIGSDLAGGPVHHRVCMTDPGRVRLKSLILPVNLTLPRDI